MAATVSYTTIIINGSIYASRDKKAFGESAANRIQISGDRFFFREIAKTIARVVLVKTIFQRKNNVPFAEFSTQLFRRRVRRVVVGENFHTRRDERWKKSCGTFRHRRYRFSKVKFGEIRNINREIFCGPRDVQRRRISEIEKKIIPL